MGMPVTVEIVDTQVKKSSIDKIYDYFKYVDEKFSTYKKTSEISKINNREILKINASHDMKEIFTLARETKKLTNGYFDIEINGYIDPSGIVKGWAIKNAANIAAAEGYKNYLIDAGGDVQVSGKNSEHDPWSVGIRNPFSLKQIVKVLRVNNEGVATSGTYERGQHIYNPITGEIKVTDILSLTVIAKNIYEADRFATAAFAMGTKGIEFIESLKGFEGYMIDKEGIGVSTSGLDKYTI